MGGGGGLEPNGLIEAYADYDNGNADDDDDNGDDDDVIVADDCFQLGTIAYFRDDHYHAVLWLTEALEVDSRETQKTSSRSQILDFLSYSLWKVSQGQGHDVH